MASTPKQPDPEVATQGELFGVLRHTEHYGELRHTTTEFTEPQMPQSSTGMETIYHVDTRERAALLHAALGNMANAASSSGFDKAQHTAARKDFEERYAPTELESRESHARFSRRSQFTQARARFLAAYNLGRSEPVAESDVDFNDAFTAFNNVYGIGGLKDAVKERRKSRDAYKKRLEDIMAIPGPKQPYAEIPTSETPPQTRPKIRPIAIEAAKTPYVSEEDRLELVAAEQSPVVGFYFSSRAERQLLRDTLRFDDYVRDIARAQRKKHGVAMSRDTAVSLYNVIEDFRQNAEESRRVLDEIKAGNLPPLEEATVVSSGYAALVRELDLEVLATEGKEPPFDPLVTTENRQNPRPGANKRVEDQYTGKVTSKEHAAYIIARVSELGREEIIAAAQAGALRQSNRILYWKRVRDASTPS